MSLGIYVHVPFCRRICPYCAFNVVRAPRALPSGPLRQAIGNEARAHASLFEGPLKTIYFGGGTPSLMTPQWLGSVIADLQTLFVSDAALEVTVEVEPDTMDQVALRALRDMGVNRLSIGWQSSVPRVLDALGRGHDADAATKLFHAARAAGFDNINVDWMIAAPGQSDEEFEQDARAIASLSPEHVSVYVLTIEPKTPFFTRRARGQLALPGEAAEVRFLADAICTLEDAGLARYEVASFARPNKQSRHNSAYWTGRPYLGLGPGAHSFMREDWRKGLRWMGHSSLQRYLNHWQHMSARPNARPEAPRNEHDVQGADVVETLGAADLALEQVMVGLRRVDGIALDAGSLIAFPQSVSQLCAQLTARGWATLSHGHLRPTQKGLLHADAAALLWEHPVRDAWRETA